MSRQILFRNFELLEPAFGELRSGYELLIEGDTVRELSETPIKAGQRMIRPPCLPRRFNETHDMEPLVPL